MTDRLLRAIACPWVDVIGHPTGRLILKRERVQVRPGARARRGGRAPASRSRSTARSTGSISTTSHARLARERGVKLVIDSDAHSPAALGVAALGRGGRAARLARAGRRAQHAARWTSFRASAPAPPPHESKKTCEIMTADRARRNQAALLQDDARDDRPRLRSRHRSAQGDAAKRSASAPRSTWRGWRRCGRNSSADGSQSEPFGPFDGNFSAASRTASGTFRSVAEHLQVPLVQPLHQLHRDRRRRLRIARQARR